MKNQPSVTYAQFSDSRGRTLDEYRRDMKRKAILELELLDWLENYLKKAHKTPEISVKKAGSDEALWFIRKGRLTTDPDYEVRIGSTVYKYELQSINTEPIPFVDFKVSKVTRKRDEKRIPKEDISFMCVRFKEPSFAVVDANWIVENGAISQVPAWRREAYRVPFEEFSFSQDTELGKILEIVRCKEIILEYQYQALIQSERIVSQEIDYSVERGTQYQLIPTSLDDFYRACVLMRALGETPSNIFAWLSRALSFAEGAHTLKSAFQFIYSLDYIYFCIEPDAPIPVLKDIVSLLHSILSLASSSYREDGSYSSNNSPTPCEDTRRACYIFSTVEDIVQDIVCYRSNEIENLGITISPVNKIFEGMNDALITARFIQGCTSS